MIERCLHCATLFSQVGAIIWRQAHISALSPVIVAHHILCHKARTPDMPAMPEATGKNSIWHDCMHTRELMTTVTCYCSEHTAPPRLIDEETVTSGCELVSPSLLCYNATLMETSCPPAAHCGSFHQKERSRATGSGSKEAGKEKGQDEVDAGNEGGNSRRGSGRFLCQERADRV